MKTYIALFRGINVGGNSTLPMKDLVSLIEELGAQNVRTYIQSGNVLFQSTEQDTTQLSQKIAIKVNGYLGFSPRILVLEPGDLEKAITQNPFPEAESDPGHLHLGFLAITPGKVDLEKLENLRQVSEQFRLIDRVFYLYAPEGVGRSRLATNSEKILGVSMTDRNWNTVCKLRELAAELED